MSFFRWMILTDVSKWVTIFRLDEFMAGFNTISLKLKEMYQVSSRFVVRAIDPPTYFMLPFRMFGFLFHINMLNV